MRIQKFEELNIWKLSLAITKDVYDLTAKGNFSKNYELRDQIGGFVVYLQKKKLNKEFLKK